MLEIISALIPFFLLGIAAAGLSRVSGVALSMIIVPTLLIWGANAIDVIAFMLLFVVYNNFTMETQDVRLDYKDLVLFPKWRLCIPFVLTIVTAYFVPAVGIAVFMACFVLELLATVFKRIPEQERPAVHRVIVLSVISAIVTAIGAYVGNHRDAFRGAWETIWADFNLFLGMFGVEASYYPAALTRSIPNPMDRMLPMITVVGGYAGLMVVFGLYNIFSIPSLITAIGAAIGIRLFGLYEFPRHGSFSYLAIGFAVAAVVCLYLVSPTPVGFDHINTLVSQPIGQ